MSIKNTFFILFSFFIGVFVFIPLHSFVLAQVTSADVVERRFLLERELAEIEEEIEEQREILQSQQRETVSLERDIIIINAQINSAELSIRSRRIVIGQLGNNIIDKEGVVSALNKKMVYGKESLSQLLRKTREMDSYSLVEVILTNKNLSEFFRDLDTFDSIKVALKESFREIEKIKKDTNQEKKNLEEKQGEEEELKNIQELQKRRIESNKRKKKEILDISKGEEAIYQKIVNEKERDATTIRTELFVLQGSAAIPFERALELANVVYKKTGVRPAFVLGVIAEESNLGANVGQCVLTNQPQKGDGKGINTGRIFKEVMKPNRDVDIFLNILKKLGLDPSVMVVSCPPSYGYGGAMGPAQFIPSTWVLYEDKIAKLTGHYPPNPWDPYDAFMASGLLLRDNGAAKGGYNNERLAALRYFAGWKNAKKASYAFYGDEVMALAAKYQRQIDILAGN